MYGFIMACVKDEGTDQTQCHTEKHGLGDKFPHAPTKRRWNQLGPGLPLRPVRPDQYFSRNIFPYVTETSTAGFDFIYFTNYSILRSLVAVMGLAQFIPSGSVTCPVDSGTGGDLSSGVE